MAKRKDPPLASPGDIARKVEAENASGLPTGASEIKGGPARVLIVRESVNLRNTDRSKWRVRFAGDLKREGYQSPIVFVPHGTAVEDVLRNDLGWEPVGESKQLTADLAAARARIAELEAK